MRLPIALLPTIAAAAAVTAAAVLSPAQAAPPGVFEPRPASRPLYGTAPPSSDPAVQRHVVEASDGVDLYVETWLPRATDRHRPAATIPTVLVMTPYASQDVAVYDGAAVAWFTARGYAVAQAHVRGTGESGGCLEQSAGQQIDDGARIVEYLGRDAPWTNGKVGMYGISYDAETQLSVAGLGDKRRTSYLKAIVPVASVGGQYEYSFYDGVPFTGFAARSNVGYLATVSATPGAQPAPTHQVEKLSCQPEVLTSSTDQDGDMTPYWQAREYRGGASSITAATLYVHGLRDFNVMPQTASGLYDRIPASTPHKGLFGVWNHQFPDRHPGVEPLLARADWLPMATAWFDRYLKGLKTGVEQWPGAQVQASDGTWRAEPDFPANGGRVGQLALGPEGSLGVTSPVGSSSFVEGVAEEARVPGDRVAFVTPPLDKELHLTGVPVLDLWLTTDRSDGHVTAAVEVLDASGEVVRHAGDFQEVAGTFGARSLQHLEPIRDNWFRQEASSPAPVGTPLRVLLRMLPTDLLVPAGGRLRVTVAGGASYSGRDLAPSGAAPTITLLHDCEHPSVLRFLMARPDVPRLDVRELDDEGPLEGEPRRRHDVDGGLATERVCGKPPVMLDAFRPTRELVGRR